MQRVNPKRRRSAHFKTRKRRGSYLGITGKYPSPHNPHCLFFEGFRERDLVVLLAFDDTVEQIEDHAITIEYTDRGRRLSYTPDFLVVFKVASGRVALLVEVKVAAELRRSGRKFAARFRAARAYCRAHGMRFRVITERSLPRPMVRNLRFLFPFRREEPHPVLDADFLALASDGLKPLSWYVEVLTTRGHAPSEVIFAAWRLGARQQLRMELDSVLSLNTKMEAAAWTVTI